MNNLLFKKALWAIAWVTTGVFSVLMISPAQAAQAADVYHYRWINQTPSTLSADGKAHIVTANTGDTVGLSVTLQNMSNTTIKGISALGIAPAGKQVPIGAYGIGVRGDAQTSWLDDSSFMLNGNRMAYYDGPDVAPNAQFTISWNVKIASNVASGSYDLYFRPVYEYKSWTAQIAWNDKLLAFDSADIFTRFIIGDTATVLAGYTSQVYGFSFNHSSDVAVFDDFLWPAFKPDDFSNYLSGGSVTMSSNHDASGMPSDAPTGPNDVYMQISIWKIGTLSIAQFLSSVGGWDLSSYTQTDKAIGGLTGKQLAPTATETAQGASTYLFVKRGEDLFRFGYLGNSAKIQTILDSVNFSML